MSAILIQTIRSRRPRLSPDEPQPRPPSPSHRTSPYRIDRIDFSPARSRTRLSGLGRSADRKDGTVDDRSGVWGEEEEELGFQFWGKFGEFE